MIFIDTSAFLAILKSDDINHQKAKKKWKEVIENQEILICSNYVLLETFALIQNRSGMKAVRIFQEAIVPLLNIEWINESIHNTGTASLLTANRRELSLVDCISFKIMRKKGINKVFTFDKHFEEQGFECIPR